MSLLRMRWDSRMYCVDPLSLQLVRRVFSIIIIHSTASLHDPFKKYEFFSEACAYSVILLWQVSQPMWFGLTSVK